MIGAQTIGDGRYLLVISAGSGPVEVGEFVARLGRHLEALCRAGGLVVERVGGAAAGAARSVELRLAGAAPAVLAGELGTHTLVERSERRGRAARKRWHAGVTLRPVDEPRQEAAIDPRDLVVSAMRASGPGGQRVNKVATAVRVLHAPTGIVVRAAGERSQRANLRRALERLTVELAARAAAGEAAERRSRRLAHHRVERGAPVRVYRTGQDGTLERVEQRDRPRDRDEEP